MHLAFLCTLICCAAHSLCLSTVLAWAQRQDLMDTLGGNDPTPTDDCPDAHATTPNAAATDRRGSPAGTSTPHEKG